MPKQKQATALAAAAEAKVLPYLCHPSYTRNCTLAPIMLLRIRRKPAADHTTVKPTL